METVKTTNRLLEALEVSYLIYDNYRETCFHIWCRIHARKKGISLQQMVTHDGIRNYYHDQWLYHVEKKFTKNYGDFFGLAEPGLLMELLADYPKTLEAYWPEALLKSIKE